MLSTHRSRTKSRFSYRSEVLLKILGLQGVVTRETERRAADNPKIGRELCEANIKTKYQRIASSAKLELSLISTES